MATILVVEDELDVQKVVAKRLTSRGFKVYCTSDGYQAVQKAHKIAPDLIVLDLQLPAGDGLSVLRKLRISDNTRMTPVVVLTGMTNELIKQSVLTEGVEAYLQKPYDSQILLYTIDKILNKPEKEDRRRKQTINGCTPEEPTTFRFRHKQASAW